MFNNIPDVKLGIIAVSRDCFIVSLSENRRKAIVEAYTKQYGDIFEAQTVVENEIDMLKAVEEVKTAYDEIVDKIIDFDQDDYGFGPFLVLDGYYAQLGADDAEKFLDNLILAVNGKKLNEPEGSETYYYFKDGKIKEE